jgi:dCMP deaminase
LAELDQRKDWQTLVKSPGCAADVSKWDRRFVELAKHIASWSKDPSTQAGAVIVDGKRRLVSVGFNGLAQGVEDLPERLNNRDLKYKMFVHCERNAIIFARQSLEGCTLYTWPFMSCGACAAMIIQTGMIRTVAPFSENPRWQDEFELATVQFKEAGVELCLIHDM